jgi:hypothetical protein
MIVHLSEFLISPLHYSLQIKGIHLIEVGFSIVVCFKNWELI